MAGSPTQFLYSRKLTGEQRYVSGMGLGCTVGKVFGTVARPPLSLHQAERMIAISGAWRLYPGGQLLAPGFNVID